MNHRRAVQLAQILDGAEAAGCCACSFCKPAFATSTAAKAFAAPARSAT